MPKCDDCGREVKYTESIPGRIGHFCFECRAQIVKMDKAFDQRWIDRSFLYYQ